MTHGLFRRMAPAFALALGATVAGCDMDFNFSSFDGVPLSELDMSGDPPTALSLAGPDEVIITEGTELGITVEGDPSAAEAVRFDLDGDTLEIGRDSDVFDGDGKAIVRVTMPAPSELSIAGSGKIDAATVASDAEIGIAGSGDVRVTEIDASRLDVSIAGNGDITSKGTVETLEISIAGSGNAKLADLKADNVEISIAGSGNVELASDGKVDASVAGSGDIVVTGSATCSIDAAGSGSLTCNPAPTATAAEPSDDSDGASAE